MSNYTKELIATLREGVEGPGDRGAYYLDSGPDAGLRRTLALLSAEEASRAWGGNSVAAHAYHLLFSFEAFAAAIAGDTTSRDWNESWRVSEVDDAQWQKLQQDLLNGYETLRNAIEVDAANGDGGVGTALAATAHLAYHIGAIRQKIAAAR